MRDIGRIILRNFSQPIVIGILLLGATLLILGERRDAWFVSVVIVINTLFAIVQEVRALLALRKLEVMSRPQAAVITPSGKTKKIDYDDIQVGMKLRLELGDEIPADGIIIKTASLEVNESMVSGESASVTKRTDETVYASTHVVAGTATIKVTAVGDDTKAGQMTHSLRRYTPSFTPLQKQIYRAITTLTIGSLALAVLIYVAYYFMDQHPVTAFKTITSAAVVVVPEGLLLGSSVLLAFGAVSLSRAKVLPQKLSAIEAMALVDVLAVDKTGTLTDPEIHFEQIKFFQHSKQNSLRQSLLAALVKETSGNNETGRAILDGLTEYVDKDGATVKDAVAFSSARKYSAGVVTLPHHATQTLVLGAPEVLAKTFKLTSSQQATVDRLQSHGKRVLLFGKVTTATSLTTTKDMSGSAFGVVVLSNNLRKGVTSTVEFLQHSGVQIKVISGDNAKTVQFIASQAGIAYAEQTVTGQQLDELSGTQWRDRVEESTIFARVQPEQKKQLIEYFQSRGHYTGMVGDGVNDALALKQADLGIAMFAGAVATRRVADIVLLNNSFTALPRGMKLGNRIMQAIELIATLFFHKIVYGVTLLFMSLAAGYVYPFQPRHVTFMNMFLVTMPTIMWTLFPPLPRHKINPRQFWQDTLRAVAPIALVSGVVVSASYAFLRIINAGSQAEIATTVVVIATFFGVYLVFLVPRMLLVTYTRAQRLAQVLYVLSVVFVGTVSFGFGLTREFFDFTMPAWRNIWPLLVLIVLAAHMQWRLANRAGIRLRQRNKINHRF